MLRLLSWLVGVNTVDSFDLIDSAGVPLGANVLISTVSKTKDYVHSAVRASRKLAFKVRPLTRNFQTRFPSRIFFPAEVLASALADALPKRGLRL